MPRHLPPLNALRAFEATARAGSFTRAADELFVTQGAVSRHVAGLERWLDVKLLDRSRRLIEPTPIGESYYRAVAAALDQIDFATRQARRRPEHPALRIKLPPTFAIRWLVPRLARFHALDPRIDVQITTSHQRADFDREPVDISIHSEPVPPVGPGFERLFDEVLIPVCAPALRRSGPPLSRPADLALHPLLCSTHRPNDWPTWLEAAGVNRPGAVVIDGNGGLKFENAALAYQAAIDRLGVMVALLPFVRDDLEQGRLIAPFDLPIRTRGGYYLAWPTGRMLAPQVTAFIAWIVAEARATPGTAMPASAGPPTTADAASGTIAENERRIRDAAPQGGSA
jgi:LysR family glycine cleavage system transcriptional activator